MRGPLNPKWKGGKKDRRPEMALFEYRVWRATIFKRDGFACVICGEDKNIEANHIHPWRDATDLRYSVDNGITLCRPHHQATFGKEYLFVESFSNAVAMRSPVQLTETEIELLKPAPAVNCLFCKAEIKNPKHRTRNKIFFCNRQCQREYRQSLPFHRVNGKFVNR
jgi:hypothetical protein